MLQSMCHLRKGCRRNGLLGKLAEHLCNGSPQLPLNHCPRLHRMSALLMLLYLKASEWSSHCKQNMTTMPLNLPQLAVCRTQLLFTLLQMQGNKT